MQHSKLVAWRTIDGPMGTVLLGHDAHGAIHACWEQLGDRSQFQREEYDPRCCPQTASHLQHYFSGTGADPAGCTEYPIPATSPFYTACWNACRMIPIGRTITYAQLARNAGNPNAVRAAAGSMRANPAALLVPCHRVVATNGGIGGFAGTTDPASPAIKLKIQLIEFESVCTGQIK
ncbi:MAG: methylated-DNA--[protein]-cysteine S-methyltransferase [Phycisphaerales bacterium]|nr:methylated-DNA--[protein]-cysteine S-methyltransferase [Phycisphaerales bacterium]